MKVFAPMSGNDWQKGQDVSGWFASEKLDGWRAVWTGTELLTAAAMPTPRRSGSRTAYPLPHSIASYGWAVV
jgi:hypothetical protein